MRGSLRYLLWTLLAVGTLVLGHPFPGYWQNGTGPAIHFQPVHWPTEPSSAASCGDTCGDWKPYTRFGRSINDPRVQDPSNGGTAPQNYVNVSSSCTDKGKPSIYYYLHKAADPANDVIMFRWRVEQPAHNYATGPSPGNYGSSSPWSSAQWTVLFDIDGSGYRSLAAHLNGSSGSPAEPIDMLAGIWSNTNYQSIDYTDPNVHLLAHNPTAFIGPTNKLMNFHSNLTPDENWPNGAAETVWDYGTTRATVVSTSPCTEYFIDYQIPVGMLDASGVGGPKLTRDTPIAMMFCTANSLSNPFQKDCALNRQWTADAAAPAPFGDYLSFNKDTSYQQPIVSSVTATPPASCPGTYKLTTKVQDALGVQNGTVVPTVKSVQFYYWYDRNGDGLATAADTGSVWTRITPAATLVSQTTNTWNANWDASALPKGKYLIGVQAVDDATALDDNMTSTNIDHRTFSYLSGDSENDIYVAGAWASGQQAVFPAHSPAQVPSSAEEWFGNPSVTGNQVALVGTAINSCGVSPTITLSAAPTSTAAGGSVGFTITVTNPSTNPSSISVDSVSDQLPTGFTYTNSSTSGTNGLPSSDPTTSGQQLTWFLGSPATLAPGASATLSFSTIATNTAGNYSSTASASTSFGSIGSSPAAVTVDAARVSLSITPNAYSIAADGATQLIYTLRYANDSGVVVTNAGISSTLPAGITYVACAGGVCNNSSGTATWTLGSLAAGVSGTATLTITVPPSYSTYSLLETATLTATAPDSSTVSATASSTVAVTGIAGAGTPAFTLTKTASSASVAPGGAVTYTLSYNNYGTASASSVVLTDVLPAGMTFNSCSGSCSNNSGTITWNIGTVAANTTGSQTVTVAAASPFTATNPAVNNASLAWSGGTPVSAQISVGVTGQSCSTYYYKNTTANVGFDGTKRIANVSPVPTASDAGSTVTATAPVSGSAFLEVLRFYQDPQTQNDVPFDGNITSNIYIDRNNGQGLNVRTTIYDYNSTTGATTQLAQNTKLFSGSAKGLLADTITPAGTLAKGHRLLWVYEARSNHSSQTVDVQFQFGGTVTNGMSGGTTFANSNATYCITPPANLALQNQVSAASINAGTTPTLTYTLRYSNTGSASATNASLIAALPSAFTGCQYSTDGSSWNTCSAPGATPPSHTFSLGTLTGGTAGTVYVRGAVPSGTTGGSTLTATSSLSSDQTVQQSASASTTVVSTGGGGTPALTLTLSANRTTAGPGTAVVYTATVINTGNAAATNVVVSNTVPSAAYYSYSNCTGSCGVAGNVITWPTVASLAAGASQTFTYTMTVGTSGLPAGVTVISDSLAASGDSSLSAVSNTVDVAVNGNPSLVLANNPTPSSGLKPRDTITYTLTLANSGAADALGVTVVNPIPAHTTYAGTITASQGTGSFDAIGNRAMFDVGTLASGASVTLTFSAQIESSLSSGTTSITSTATADSSNSAQQIASATVSATATPVLAISKTAPSSVAYPSAVLTAAANGTTLFVDRTDRLHVNQLIKIGSQVARVVALAGRSILVDSVVTAANGTALNGEMAITIAYRNDGDADASGVVVREALTAGFGYYSASPSPSSSPLTGNSGNVDWNIGTLAAGTSATLQVLSFPSGSTGSFSNVSTISASNASTATATAVTTIGGLSVTKSSSTPVISAGDNAQYTIVVSNSLGSPVSGVAVSDKLPQGFTYVTSSATIGGASVEPTFDAADTAKIQPTWSSLTVPANGSLNITFQAQVAGSTGAGAYQNELEMSAPGGVGTMGFDPLLTTAEDVNVLPAASGVLKGYVFSRVSGSTLAFDPLTDTPLAGVRVEIHKSGADCNNPVGGNCFVVYTDANGYFEHVVAAEAWIVSVKENTGDLPSGWTQIAGNNNDTVNVPDQGTATDYNGYTSTAPTTHTVTAVAGANGSITPSSSTVNDGSTTSFTVTPQTGYVIDTVTGCGGSLSGNTFTTGAITGDCTVNASFVAAGSPTHTVTAAAGSGGSISPASATVNDGATTSFTVTPNAGFSIASVTGCGGSLSGNVYTTSAITAACGVSAAFVSNSVPSHLVSATAGAGGSVTPTSTLVADGTTTTFTVTPDVGFSVGTVTGCGGTLSNSIYTTGMVTGPCTVSATFTADPIPTYTVTATAGSGGSISPGTTQVQQGATASFAVVTDASHAIASVTGCNGALAENVYTTSAVMSSCAVTATFSVTAPIFDPAPPVSINARALFTDVPLNIAPRATDGNGNVLAVTLVGSSKLRPGRHILTWSATDSQGRTMTTEQQLDIWPTVSLSNDVVIGFGSAGTFQMLLNGDAPTYPFTASYTVTGPGYGVLHNLASAAVTFTSGTEASVQFDALPQGTSMPTQHLDVELDRSLNIGVRGALDVSLTSENYAPSVVIAVSQADRTGTLIAKDAGPVTLHATVSDPNPRDTHTYQWTYPRAAVVQLSADGTTVTLEPSGLAEGLQNFAVTVTDSGSPPLSNKATVTLALRAASLQLGAGDSNDNGIADDVEGWSTAANGIPDYLNRSSEKNVLPEDAPVIDSYLVEGDAGVQLRIGGYSQLTGVGGARLDKSIASSITTNDTVNNVGGVFDIEAVELANPATIVRAVIPQRRVIPTQPVYRLWDGQQKRWYTFVEDGSNTLSSAPGEAGYCPPPGDSAYRPGLHAGDWCVEVAIADGGADDADLEKNMALAFTGGIGEQTNSVVTGTSTGGGGGSMGMFTWVLALLAYLRQVRRMRSAITFGVLLLPLAAQADENKCTAQGIDCFYVGGSAALVHGSADANDMDARLLAQGYVTETHLSGQNRLGGAIFGGYRWRAVAAELGYAHLGTLHSRVEGLTPVDDAYLRAISRAHPRSGKGPQASASLYLPLGKTFEAYGRAGLFYWQNTQSAQGFDQYADENGWQLDPFFGVGLQLRPLYRKLAMHAEFQFYKLDGEKITSIGLGLKYRLPW